MNNLVDPVDGENRAVRGFLLGLEANCYTIGAMKTHMRRYGTPYWPHWVDKSALSMHMSKYNQQAWLRYLFDLEKE